MGKLELKNLKDKGYLFYLFILLTYGCASPNERVMPFVNLEYSGERLFPVAKNDAEFAFRARMNFSTTIDRVLTISYDKDLGYVGKLLAIKRGKSGTKNKDNTIFKEINVTPTSGFEKFIAKVDSLNLMNLADQEENNFPLTYDTPFSLYIIEIKRHGKTNQFRFNTHFPYHEKVEEKYQKIEELLFEEFKFKFYFKKKKNVHIASKS